MFSLSLSIDHFFPILLGFIVVVLFWWHRRKENNTANLPPGPIPVPILGNYFQLDLKEPYKSYLEFSKKYGSIFTVWLGSKPVVVLAGYQTLKEALVNKGEEFSGRGVYPVLLQASKGHGLLASSKWKDLRKFSLMTLKNFGMGCKSIEDRVQEEARCLVQAFSDYGDMAFNPHNLLCNAVSNGICFIIFGKRFEYDDHHFKFLQKGLDSYFHFLNSSKGQFFNMFPRLSWHLPGPHHELFEHIEKIRSYMKQEAEERLSHLDINCPQDYIEAFLVRMLEEKHKPDSEFHLDSLVSSIWNLFSAGTETTSSTLRHGLLLMMKYPHIQERVQKEIDEVVGSSRSPSAEDRQNMPYTEAVIHEIQRHMDLAPMAVPHKMMGDTLFKGYLLPKGMMVYPLLSSVLFDPKLWKNPGVFDPENFLDESGRFKKNDAFLPFGLGKRACIGERLARVELFLFFSSLLQRFTFRGTEPPEDIDIRPSCNSFGRIPRMYSCYAQLRE